MAAEQSQHFIFTIARMNPPTPGHLLIIEELINEAVSKEAGEVYVILSKSNETNDDPLDCQTKKEVILKMLTSVPGQRLGRDDIGEFVVSKQIKVYILCVPDLGLVSKNANSSKRKSKNDTPKKVLSTPFTYLKSLSLHLYTKGGPLNMMLIVGEDRKAMMDNIVHLFLDTPEHIFQIAVKAFRRGEGNIDMEHVKEMSKNKEAFKQLKIGMKELVGSISGSMVRNFVKTDNIEKFTEVYEGLLHPKEIEALFENIKTGMSLHTKTKPKSAPALTVKYNRIMSRKNLQNLRDEKAKAKENAKNNPPKKRTKKNNKN